MTFPKTAAALAKAERSQWEIGDALVEEIATYPGGDSVADQFKAAAEFVKKTNGRSYAAPTLKSMWQTARAFNPNERLWDVPFEHYRHVANLPAEERASILQKAQENKWTKYELRAHLGHKGTTPLSAAAMTNEQIHRFIDENPEGFAEALSENFTAAMKFFQIQQEKGRRTKTHDNASDVVSDALENLVLRLAAEKVHTRASDILTSGKDPAYLNSVDAEMREAIADGQREAAETLSEAADLLKTAAMFFDNPELAKQLLA